MCDVLLLEDNPDALERVRMALELRGHVVRISWKPDRTLRCLGPEGPASRL
ncbi:response regulator [Muricoccus vinaceus]|uniref:Response regulatory domain-containing protein n=1 Tax=Muricoccus vinaceus TaxID=424704 RepID=A0ABV6IXA0_9PROT